MKKRIFLVLFVLAIGLVSCQTQTTQPAAVAEASTATIELPTATATVSEYIQTINANMTESAQNSPTPKPTKTNTPTPVIELPVTHETPFPGELVPLTADNIDQIELIGTFGEGQYLSTHFSDDQERIAIVYSTRIETYQNVYGTFKLDQTFNFDIYTNSALFEYGDIPAYKISDSLQFFVQNYGDRVRILNLITGNEIFISLSNEDPRVQSFPVQNLIFSPDENYLAIDSSHEQVLVNLNTFEESLRINGDTANFSNDEKYYIVGRWYEDGEKFDIYTLPNLLLENEVKGFDSSNSPYWATITSDSKLITVGQSKITLWSYPELMKLSDKTLPRNFYLTGRIEMTTDEQYLILGERDGIVIWDLTEFTQAASLLKDTNFGNDFIISPNQRQALLFRGDENLIVNIQDGTVLAEIDFWIQEFHFTEQGNFLLIPEFTDEREHVLNIFDLIHQDVIEINLDTEFYNGTLLGITDQFLWLKETIDQKPVLHRLNLVTEEITTQELDSFSSLQYQEGKMALFRNYTQQTTELRDLSNFSLISSELPYPAYNDAYSLMYPLQDRDAGETWYGQRPFDSQTFSSAIRWKVDEDELEKAFYYLRTRLPDAEYGYWKPYIRNIQSPDGKYEAEFEDYSGILSIYNAQDRTLIREINTFGNNIYNFDFSSSLDYVFITGDQFNPYKPNWLLVYEVATENFIQKHEIAYWFFCNGIIMDVSPDGKYLAIKNETDQMDVIDIENNWTVLYSVDQLNCSSDIQFSPDGSYIAVGSIGDEIKFWDTETGAFITSINIFDGYYFGEGRKAIQFYLLDNLVIASAYNEGTGFGQIKVYGILEP